MFQFNVTLPLTQHNGVSNQSTINAIKKLVASKFGGYSFLRIDGGWFDNGLLYEDTSILLWTLVHEENDVNELLELAHEWAIELQQIELLVTVQSNVDATFVLGTRAQAIA